MNSTLSKTRPVRCQGITKNGKKCTWKSAYMGYCRIHGKHLKVNSKDPYDLIKDGGTSQFIEEMILDGKLDPNYVKNGQTVIHRLIKDKHKDLFKYCRILNSSGKFDIEKCSIDTFTVDKVTYVDTEISPIIYLMYASTMYLGRKRTAISNLIGYLENINKSFNGEHILTRALNSGFDDVIARVVYIAKDSEFLKRIRDKKGNNILLSCIKRLVKKKRELTIDADTRLKVLFSHKTLANIKDANGALPAVTLLKMIGNPEYKIGTLSTNYIDFFGATDLSNTDKDGISILEMSEFQSLDLKNVYDYIQDLKKKNVNHENIEDYKNKKVIYPYNGCIISQVHSFLNAYVNYDRKRMMIKSNAETARNALKSLLDIIFTFKLVVKRRKKGMCKLVGNKIVEYLIAEYD